MISWWINVISISTESFEIFRFYCESQMTEYPLGKRGNARCVIPEGQNTSL